MPPSRITRTTSLLLCLVVYLVAAAAAVIAGHLLHWDSPLFLAGLADCVATVVVFAFSVALDNSSMYDPYWSVAPVPICLYWILRFGTGLGAREIAVCILLLAWAVRLTFNWARRWKGLADEDWRYADYRRFGAGYWPVSFAGFHFFPTLLVFAGCLSLLPVLSPGARGLGLLDIAGLCATAGAILVESAADRQLRRFGATKGGARRILDTGLWGVSRHPNYFGEVLFWWGLYLFGLAADPGWWWTVIGPVCITALFLGVSVPMMDRRMLARHPGYARVMATRSALVPWPARKR